MMGQKIKCDQCGNVFAQHWVHIDNKHKLSENINKLWLERGGLLPTEYDGTRHMRPRKYASLHFAQCILWRFANNCCILCGIFIVSTSFDNLHQKWATRLFKYHDVPKKIYYMKTQLPNPVQNYEICRKFNHFGNLLSPIW